MSMSERDRAATARAQSQTERTFEKEKWVKQQEEYWNEVWRQVREQDLAETTRLEKQKELETNQLKKQQQLEEEQRRTSHQISDPLCPLCGHFLERGDGGRSSHCPNKECLAFMVVRGA